LTIAFIGTVQSELLDLLSWIMVEISCSAILFDLDGVLIDSTPAVARVWKWWAQQHGLDANEVVHKAHGRPSISTIRDYLPKADAEAENLKVERAEIEDLEGVSAYPGAKELLTSLPHDRWTIVTSCTRKLAEVRIAHAGLPMPERIVTATDVTHGKPSPEPYLKGAELLQVPAGECIVVEDAPAGVQAGKAAHARVIGVTTTYPAEKMKHTTADWVVRNCSAISSQHSNRQPLRLRLHNIT
jgi:sugar-phosphatase